MPLYSLKNRQFRLNDDYSPPSLCPTLDPKLLKGQLRNDGTVDLVL